jgi:hypothetical protein
MATRNDQPAVTTDRMAQAKRSLLEYQYLVYTSIVARKHGTSAPFQATDLGVLTDAELQSLVEAVRDMAHLPPA